ncbi:MAG: asparagine synthase (glutamine-hydrolyzing) [Gemmatimonas sp.]
MCGIVAIFAYGRRAPAVDTEEVVRIRDAMAPRGPDAQGAWLSDDRRVGFGHRRLAIIDVGPSGLQPMTLAGAATRIVFNGEIYNYRDLRRELEARGRVFRTNSDTEVILHGYEEYGRDVVRRLRGMFAFAIWDERNRGLFLARDPLGIKPLYYADDGRTIRVASQVKALVCGAVDAAIDPTACVSFYLLGYVAEPFTIQRRVRALPAGSTMWVTGAGAETPRPYFSVRDALLAAEDAPRLSTDREAVGAAIRASVAAHMVSDVPVGVFLSAGLDSSVVAAMAQEHAGAPLKTVTLGFEEFRGTPDDEAPLAESIAAAMKSDHRTVWVRGHDFLAEREQLFKAMDQPTIDGVNTYFVSKAAAAAGVKVALSGLGGDELFGGYPSFSQVPRIVAALGSLRAAPWLGRAVRVVSSAVIGNRLSPKYAGLLEYGTSFEDAYLLRRALFMPWELPAVLDPEIIRTGWRELRPLLSLRETVAGIGRHHSRVAALEMTWYMRNQLLRDTDWASMAHSVEVRTPLVDVELLGELAPMLVSARPPTKIDMALASAIGSMDPVLKRAKTGFSTPVQQWLNEESPDSTVPARGLRTWSKVVFSRHTGL